MPPITIGLGPQRLLFNKTPLWISTPTPVFNEGAGFQTYLITSAHISDADVGDVLTLSYVGLSLSGTGVSFREGPLGFARYEYSGVGNASVTGGQIRAMDSAIPSRSANSAVHTITITPVGPVNLPPIWLSTNFSFVEGIPGNKTAASMITDATGPVVVTRLSGDTANGVSWNDGIKAWEYNGSSSLGSSTWNMRASDGVNPPVDAVITHTVNAPSPVQISWAWWSDFGGATVGYGYLGSGGQAYAGPPDIYGSSSPGAMGNWIGFGIPQNGAEVAALWAKAAAGNVPVGSNPAVRVVDRMMTPVFGAYMELAWDEERPLIASMPG